MCTILVVILFILRLSASERILCIFPAPFYSHQSVFQSIWRELSVRGHEVTVITTNPIGNANLTNLKEIDLSFSYKLVYKDHNVQYIMNTESNLLVLMKHLFFIGNNLTAEQLKHQHVQKLMRSNEQHFDLVILEAHGPAWFGLAGKYKCPIIAVTTMEPTNMWKGLMGNVNNPILYPHINMPFGNILTLKERVLTVIFELFDLFLFHCVTLPINQKYIREAMADPSIQLAEVYRNVSLVISTVLPGFNRVTPKIPSIVELNGLQIGPPKALPDDLQAFLDGANQGVIYFSLGSNVKSYLLSPEKRAIFLDVFKELPFKVLWKFEQINDDLPGNVKLVSWAPQHDIFRYGNVKLFITQGGIQSIEEAIRFKIPMLAFPFFGDQFFNSIRLEYLGLGRFLDFKTLNKETLKETILSITRNDTYGHNLEEMSDMLTQQPLDSLKTAIWWIEYVMKHKGAPHLKSPLADMPFYQYYLLDVVLFIIVFFVVLFLLCYKIFRAFFIPHYSYITQRKKYE